MFIVPHKVCRNIFVGWISMRAYQSQYRKQYEEQFKQQQQQENPRPPTRKQGKIADDELAHKIFIEQTSGK